MMKWRHIAVLDVRLPAGKQSTKVVDVPRLLDEMVDLSSHTQLNSVFKSWQFLFEAQQDAFSHFVDRLGSSAAVFYTPSHTTKQTTMTTNTAQCQPFSICLYQLVHVIEWLFQSYERNINDNFIHKRTISSMSVIAKIRSSHFKVTFIRRRTDHTWATSHHFIQ